MSDPERKNLLIPALFSTLGYEQEHPTTAGSPTSFHSEVHAFFRKYTSNVEHIPPSRSDPYLQATRCATSFCEEAGYGQKYWPNDPKGILTWPADKETIIDTLAHVFRRKAISADVYWYQKRKRDDEINAKAPKKAKRAEQSAEKLSTIDCGDAADAEESYDAETNMQKSNLSALDPYHSLVPWTEPPVRLSSQDLIIYVSSLNPVYDQDVLKDFTLKWLSTEGADWPQSADHRLQTYMHDHDYYFCSETESLPPFELINRLREGTEIASQMAGLQVPKFCNRIMERVISLSTKLVGDVFLEFHDGVPRKTDRFRQFWNNKEQHFRKRRPSKVDENAKPNKRRRTKRASKSLPTLLPNSLDKSMLSPSTNYETAAGGGVHFAVGEHLGQLEMERSASSLELQQTSSELENYDCSNYSPLTTTGSTPDDIIEVEVPRMMDRAERSYSTPQRPSTSFYCSKPSKIIKLKTCYIPPADDTRQSPSPAADALSGSGTTELPVAQNLQTKIAATQLPSSECPTAHISGPTNLVYSTIPGLTLLNTHRQPDFSADSNLSRSLSHSRSPSGSSIEGQQVESQATTPATASTFPIASANNGSATGFVAPTSAGGGLNMSCSDPLSGNATFTEIPNWFDEDPFGDHEAESQMFYDGKAVNGSSADDPQERFESPCEMHGLVPEALYHGQRGISHVSDEENSSQQSQPSHQRSPSPAPSTGDPPVRISPHETVEDDFDGRYIDIPQNDGLNHLNNLVKGVLEANHQQDHGRELHPAIRCPILGPNHLKEDTIPKCGTPLPCQATHQSQSGAEGGDSVSPREAAPTHTMSTDKAFPEVTILPKVATAPSQTGNGASTLITPSTPVAHSLTAQMTTSHVVSGNQTRTASPMSPPQSPIQSTNQVPVPSGEQSMPSPNLSPKIPPTSVSRSPAPSSTEPCVPPRRDGWYALDHTLIPYSKHLSGKEERNEEQLAPPMVLSTDRRLDRFSAGTPTTPPTKTLELYLEKADGELDFDKSFPPVTFWGTPTSRRTVGGATISDFFFWFSQKSGVPLSDLTMLTLVLAFDKIQRIVVHRFKGEKPWKMVKEQIYTLWEEEKKAFPDVADFSMWVKVGNVKPGQAGL